MYIAGFFKEHDLGKVKSFMQRNDFAIVVGFDGSAPVASHILVDVEENESGMFISGHVAKGNPLWRILESGKEALVIFSGPSAYISPRWYNHVNVPTWNYIAVHAYGIPSLITQPEEMRSLLRKIVSTYEPGTSYTFDGLPEDFATQQIRGIMGFRIAVTRLEASSKLSQNRSDEDYANIIRELDHRPDENSHQVANAMREKRPGSSE